MSPVSPIRAVQTIATLLEEGSTYLREKEIETPRVEVEYILAAILDCQRLDLYLDSKKEVAPKCIRRFWNDLVRRADHEPLQYITGSVEFYGMPFAVSRDVFIPRPETELIVEAAKGLFPPPRRILDLCTGSGVLAIVLARVFSSARLVAIDYSDRALAFARINAKKHGCASRIGLIKGDLCEPLRKNNVELCKFDLIVSNPPYISEEDRESLPPEVREYEPEIALFAGDRGRAYYRRILSSALPLLAEDGLILLELGVNQAEWLRCFVENEVNTKGNKWDLSFVVDWAGIDRVARISKRRV